MHVSITLLFINLFATSISMTQEASGNSDLILKRISFIVTPKSLAGISFFGRLEGRYSLWLDWTSRRKLGTNFFGINILFTYLNESININS